MERGCELDACDRIGWTAAMHAAFAGEALCLQRLIEGGAYLDAQDFLGTTAAMRAAMRGSQECVRLLLRFGADLKHKDQLGFTAAMHARRRGHAECEMLLAVPKTKGSHSARRERSTNDASLANITNIASAHRTKGS